MPLIEQRIATANPVAGAVLKLNYLRLDRDEQSRRVPNGLEAGADDPARGGRQIWTPVTGVGHYQLTLALPG